MSRGSGAAVIAGALGLVGLLGLAAWSMRPRGATGPFLSIEQRDSGETPRRSIATPAAIALALGGLPVEELPRLRTHLAEAADVAARQAAPELFDLDGLSQDAGLDPPRQALPDLPSLTAAANLRGAPWESPGISVQLVASCEAAAARCVPLFSPADDGDSLVRRGRSLAWALANAGLVRAPAGARPALLRSLRAAQLGPSGTIALVFDVARGRLDEAQLGPLRQEARRSLADLPAGAPQRPWLEALAAAQPDWELPIHLDADQVLVVPRLRVLARLQDFTSEVEGAGAIEWIARPGVRAGRR